MAVPKDTQKELMVVVETKDVAISPPVLDSVVVVGHAPRPDSNTLLYAGYTDDVLNVRTVSGQAFQIGEVVQVTTVIAEQILVGPSSPGALDGEYNNRIYMDSTNKGIYIWEDPADIDWANQQVFVVQALPSTAANNQIFIDQPRNSIWVWYQ